MDIRNRSQMVNPDRCADLATSPDLCSEIAGAV
jgi:hypothetical protein